MEDVDVANWRDIDAGIRPISWSDIIGDPDSAPFLTNAGRELSRRMAFDLTAFVGQGWLPSVLRERDKPHRVRSVFQNAPTLALSPEATVDSFLAMVRWWASIAVNANSPGISKVRRDLQANLTEQRFLHTVTMLRLGAMARSAGLRLAFEPTPGDLLVAPTDEIAAAAEPSCGSLGMAGGLGGDGKPVTIEVAVMGVPLPVAEFERRTEELFEHLRSLERTHDVHFHGQLPHPDGMGQEDMTLDAWRVRTTEAAEIAARSGISLKVDTDGHIVHVTPGRAPGGTRMEGALLVADVRNRIQRTVRAKSQQVSAAPNAWLWVENQGAVDALNNFNQLTSPQQVTAMRDLVEPALAEFPRVRGLTFSTETRHFGPSPAPNRVAVGASDLLSVPVWPARRRTSITLRRESSFYVSIIDRIQSAEEGWLDWALGQIIGARATDLIAGTTNA